MVIGGRKIGIRWGTSSILKVVKSLGIRNREIDNQISYKTVYNCKYIMQS